MFLLLTFLIIITNHLLFSLHFFQLISQPVSRSKPVRGTWKYREPLHSPEIWGIESLSQALIFLSLYFYNPMTCTWDISNYEFCEIHSLSLKYQFPLIIFYFFIKRFHDRITTYPFLLGNNQAMKLLKM